MADIRVDRNDGTIIEEDNATITTQRTNNGVRVNRIRTDRNIRNNDGVITVGSNNRVYRNNRGNAQVEDQTQNVEKKNVAVNLEQNIRSTDIGIDALSSRKDEIISKLDTVASSLVDFYDNLLMEYGAQGLTDGQGRIYSPANYSTPAEKLAALEGIVAYNIENKIALEKGRQRVLELAKDKKNDLKSQSLKLLDDQKELISKNNDLINAADLDIAEDKKKSLELASKIEQENATLKSKEEQKQKEENKIEEYKKEIGLLQTEMADIRKEVEEMRKAEIEANSSSNAGGKQRNNNNQMGYYNAKSENIRQLAEQIKIKETAIESSNKNILDFNSSIATCNANIINFQREKENIDTITAKKETDLEVLRTKNKDLVKKFWQTVPELENAFEQNIDGAYDDGIRLNYKKDSKENAEQSQDNNATSEVTPQAEQVEEGDAKAVQQGGAGTGTVVSDAVSGALPQNVSEQELASNYIYHFIHSMSASERRQIINGPGFDSMISAMDSAGMFKRRELRAALIDMQQDLEEDVPTIDEFRNRMGNVLPNSDLDALYEAMFDQDDKGNITCNDFSKLNLDEIRHIQKALDEFSSLKFNGKLTAEQAQLFEDNFAQYAKVATLLQNNMKGSLGKSFQRFFKGKEYNAQRKLLISFSKYSESRFNDLNAQYAHMNSFKRELGANVEDTPRYAENRGSIERTKRGLSKNVEDGKMNYR